jgi:hypothetical protein
MSFTSPIWLVGLFPWILVVLWLLLNQREQTGVPFLLLWKNEQAVRRTRKALRAPPLALAAALAAAAVSIFAAAGPAFSIRGNSVEKIHVVVDRGLTMSASNAQGQFRFIEAAKALDVALRREIPGASVDLAIAPAQPASAANGDQWVAIVERQSPTGVTNADALNAAIRAALAQSSGPVVVLSDRILQISDSRLVQVAPQSPLVNVGIESFTARFNPHPAAMVRLFNQSPLTSATITLLVDGQSISQSVQLPARGERRNYFFDLPSVGKVLEAQVQANDNPAPDHRAWLVRQSAWPRIAPRLPLPRELQRMIEVYTKLRPPGEESQTVAVVNSTADAPVDQPVAIVVDSTDANTVFNLNDVTVTGNSSLDISAIDWHKALAGARAAPLPAGDWTPVVSAGATPIVLIRLHPKAVWVGFDSPDFARSADFVIFWSRIFDWLSDDAPIYRSQAVGPLLGQWQLIQPDTATSTDRDMGLTPGLYRARDGNLLAVNSQAPVIEPSGSNVWIDRLNEQVYQATTRQFSFLTCLAMLALLGVILTTVLWPVVRRQFAVNQ